MKKIVISALLAVCTGNCFQSCTNLDEDVYSYIQTDDFFKNEQEMVMNIGRIYDYMKQYTHYFNMWGALTISADEAICPFREGNLWWDNGVWIDLHSHNFHSHVNNNAWDFIFGGVALCNQILYMIEESPVDFASKPNLIAEVKVMRAWFYMNGIDLFGNIPFTDNFKDEGLPPQKDRQFLFPWIEKELKENVEALPAIPATSNYGRPTQAMAYTVLAKLYINAEEWIGKEMWQETVDVCAKVRKLGMTLESDYFANFKVNNENSKENIMVVVYDNVQTSGDWTYNFKLHQETLYTLSQQTFGIVDFCWDGFCVTESLYNSYDENDVRRKSWLAGPQYDKSGNPLMYRGEPFSYNVSVTSLYDPQNPAKTEDGARCAKYEYEDGLQGSMSNDFVIYRYADVLMMEGEALVRMGKATEAFPLFNEVRRRAGVAEYTASQLTLDEILAERGREFAWEGLRRQDQIRFGTWGKAWDFKEPSEDYKKLFPIPYWALLSNPTLQQEPGYTN